MGSVALCSVVGYMNERDTFGLLVWPLGWIGAMLILWAVARWKLNWPARLADRVFAVLIVVGALLLAALTGLP